MFTITHSILEYVFRKTSIKIYTTQINSYNEAAAIVCVLKKSSRVCHTNYTFFINKKLGSLLITIFKLGLPKNKKIWNNKNLAFCG